MWPFACDDTNEFPLSSRSRLPHPGLLLLFFVIPKKDKKETKQKKKILWVGEFLVRLGRSCLTATEAAVTGSTIKLGKQNISMPCATSVWKCPVIMNNEIPVSTDAVGTSTSSEIIQRQRPANHGPSPLCTLCRFHWRGPDELPTGQRYLYRDKKKKKELERSFFFDGMSCDQRIWTNAPRVCLRPAGQEIKRPVRFLCATKTKQTVANGKRWKKQESYYRITIQLVWSIVPL